MMTSHRSLPYHRGLIHIVLLYSCKYSLGLKPMAESGPAATNIMADRWSMLRCHA